ncbi:unnamed protein product [Ilex paraguariensis]|uniref:RING-type domain-containing protein n=1 Tax=Ilex paraguariensis TaxID=185542 RepID=A0ABC8SDF6_9AQUA
MLGSNIGNEAIPVFLEENCFQYPANSSNQLQLFQHLPVGCTVDKVNYFGSENKTPIFRPNKRGREAKDISRQRKLQISWNQNIYHDEADRPTAIQNQNPVSTGLKLSYDDDERNSSVTSTSRSMTAPSSIILPLSDNMMTELDRQTEELDQYIKTQEIHLVKGLRDIKQRHTASFLTALQKGVGKKLHEKDVELENINRKNRELVEKMKKVVMEAQNWCYRAKYNESVVSILKTKLQQALHGADQAKEGFGDSDIDDAASCSYTNNYVNVPSGAGKLMKSVKDNMICRACKGKELSILLMPCRHLCLCKDCEGLFNVCPVCQLPKTASVQVYLS